VGPVPFGQPPRSPERSEVASKFVPLKNKKQKIHPKDSPSINCPLGRNLNAWQDLDPPSFVLEAVQGHLISFKSRPPLVPANPSFETSVAGPSTDSMDNSVRELLRKKAIEPAPSNPGFYSRIFEVPKKDGTMRPVINLKPLNRFVSVPKFRMASVSTVGRMIQDGDWAASIDLKDAFFHIPIHRRHRRFL
jgi:hypothetical protein